MNSKQKTYFKTGDSIYIIIRGICKGSRLLLPDRIYALPEELASATTARPTFIKVHGNILYDFSYRSYIDTPFAQANLMQHLVQTNLNFLIREKYPVSLTITNRSNNSRYFRDFTDVNIQFSQRQLINNIKSDLSSRVNDMVDQKPLFKAQQTLAALQTEMQSLGEWLTDPARTQEIVEEKEKLYSNKNDLPTSLNRDHLVTGTGSIEDSLIKVNRHYPDSFFHSKMSEAGLKRVLPGNRYNKLPMFKPDQNFSEISKLWLSDLAKDKVNKVEVPSTKDSGYIEKYNTRKQHFENLRNDVKNAEEKVRVLNKQVQEHKNRLYNEINNLRNKDGLYAFMDSNHIPKKELTKAQQVLLSVNKIGIGRSWVDYSELTVKNVSVSGLNIEINPRRFYFAFAMGKVNYRFRDFVHDDRQKMPDQRLYAVRAGVGRIDRNSIIATFYNGKRSLLNYGQSPVNAGMQKVIGVSLEGKMNINRNNYLIGEIAKSSLRNNIPVNPGSSGSITKVFDFKNHTNEAYSIRLFSQNPSTGTKLTAYYKKTGQNFHSFNLYPTNVQQEAWMVKLDQQVWKKRLVLDAAIRKNDFVNPYANQSFSSQAVFKSLQATLRIPKYPFVSIGYYPASQLSINSDKVLSENHYNTFNTIVSHSYKANHVAMNSNAVFTRFYNNSNDTGFIYSNATSFVLNHSVFLLPFTLQTSIGSTVQKKLNLFTLEEQFGYQVMNFLSVIAGVKWSRLNRTESLFGGTAAMSLRIKRIGTFQLNYDKSYLPSNTINLMPVDIGRMSFYKEF